MRDSKSRAARRAGSIPALGTNIEYAPSWVRFSFQIKPLACEESSALINLSPNSPSHNNPFLRQQDEQHKYGPDSLK